MNNVKNSLYMEITLGHSGMRKLRFKIIKKL